METELKIRLDKLESQLRHWKIITALVLIAATVFVITAAAPPQDNGFVQQFPAPKVSAELFLLVGKDGKTYGRLTTKDKQPTLELFDQNGKTIWQAPPHGGFTPVNTK